MNKTHEPIASKVFKVKKNEVSVDFFFDENPSKDLNGSSIKWRK